jgi:hypothetical protein
MERGPDVVDVGLQFGEMLGPDQRHAGLDLGAVRERHYGHAELQPLIIKLGAHFIDMHGPDGGGTDLDGVVGPGGAKGRPGGGQEGRREGECQKPVILIDHCPPRNLNVAR